MQTVGIKVLKNRLSEYVRRAAAGETVLVTDRDRIVAELVPHRPATQPQTEDEILADMERRGILRRAIKPVGPLPEPLGPGVGFERLMADLAADREDR